MSKRNLLDPLKDRKFCSWLPFFTQQIGSHVVWYLFFPAIQDRSIVYLLNNMVVSASSGNTVGWWNIRFYWKWESITLNALSAVIEYDES